MYEIAIVQLRWFQCLVSSAFASLDVAMFSPTYSGRVSELADSAGRSNSALSR